MGKSLLTRADMERMFPTIASLKIRCGNSDPTRWGILWNSTYKQTSLGEQSGAWTLCCSFRRIEQDPSCHMLCQRYGSEHIFLYYCVNIETEVLYRIYVHLENQILFRPHWNSERHLFDGVLEY